LQKFLGISGARLFGCVSADSRGQQGISRAVAIASTKWEPTERAADNAIVVYEVELPGDFLEKGGSDNKTFVSITDWSGSEASGNLKFPHILGYQSRRTAPPLHWA